MQPTPCGEMFFPAARKGKAVASHERLSSTGGLHSHTANDSSLAAPFAITCV